MQFHFPRKASQLNFFTSTHQLHSASLMMTSISEGLFKSLPKPKYSGQDEDIPHHAQPRGPRVLGPDQVDETQIVLRVSNVYTLAYIDSTNAIIRKPAHRPTETAPAGGPAPQKTSAMEARSPRSWSRSIHWTWDGRGDHRARMR